MKIIYLDLETTGVDENICGIYQMSGLIEIDGHVIDEFDYMINPGDVHVDEWVITTMKSKGIELEDVLTYSSGAFVHSKLIELLDKHVDKFDPADKFHLCGYNVAFDDRFLRKLFKENGNDFYGAYIYSNRLCVMNLASYVLAPIRHKLSNFTLQTLCKIFNISIDAHDAKSDIEATYKLYQGLKNYLVVKELE